MTKAVVMKLNGKEALVLMNDGTFQNVKRDPSWRVGEKIQMEVPAVATYRKKKRFFTPAMATAASFLIVFSSLFAFSGTSENKAYAAVNIDMQPSIEFKVDKDMGVIDAYALNTSGQEMLGQLVDWEGANLKDVTKQFVELSIEEGYLCPVDTDILVDTHVNNENDDEYEKLVNETIQEVVSEYKLHPHEDHLHEKGLSWADVEVWEAEINVHHIDTASEVREQAKELGISPAKYVVYQSAVEEGAHISLEDVKNNSISDLPDMIKHVHNVEKVKGGHLQKLQEVEIEDDLQELTKSEKEEVKEAKKEIKERTKEVKNEQKEIKKAEKAQQKAEKKLEKQSKIKDLPKVDVEKFNKDKANKAKKDNKDKHNNGQGNNGHGKQNNGNKGNGNRGNGNQK